MLNNIVDNFEQCGQQNIAQCCFHHARTGCSFFAVYFSIDNPRNGLETQAKVYTTSVIRFALEPCNFTLNLFIYFKQEQKCECNYRLLKLFKEINKAENHHLMFP